MRSAKIQLAFDPTLPTDPHLGPNPVVPGDHPDPTILRVGETFWASATSGEWSPQFPLFRSTDLTRWTPAGSIFPTQPAWAEGSFWAPELVHDEVTGTFACWYVARQRGGPLTIAVATAQAPEGPWTDHGPLVAEPDGSIDPCFARDEHGAPYLIWKEDGNSINQPTPIWAQPLSDDLLTLHGSKTQLITNDQPWEDGVVEGPYILRHGAPGRMRFYLFYAGNTCCGQQCKYAEGVARADKLLGPWEKLPNPLIDSNESWRCPGHGTAVHTSAHRGQPAQDYLLYHAYPAQETIFVGREAILDEITWTPDDPDGRPGWPIVNAGRGPSQPTSAILIDLKDDFQHHGLGPAWQWPVNTTPETIVHNGTLTLGIPMHSPLAQGPVESAMLAVPRPASRHYRATVTLLPPTTPEDQLWAGLSIVGDPFNTIGLGLRGTRLILWERRGDRQQEIWSTEAPQAKAIHLRSTSVGAEHHLLFAFSTDAEHWQQAGAEYNASDLPAWDRGLRIALMLEGPLGHKAHFQSFELRAL